MHIHIIVRHNACKKEQKIDEEETASLDRLEPPA